jgi:hypothetical protein
MIRDSLSRILVFCTIIQFAVVGSLVPTVKASMVSTGAVVESQSIDDTRTQLNTLLAREDVRDELIRLGVDPEMATERINDMTPTQLLQFRDNVAELPAGAGALEVIGIVFLVLLILEFLGVTNVFTRV